METQYTLKVYPAGLGRSVYRTITICDTDMPPMEEFAE